jgi:hypothetical protein
MCLAARIARQRDYGRLNWLVAPASFRRAACYGVNPGWPLPLFPTNFVFAGYQVIVTESPEILRGARFAWRT